MHGEFLLRFHTCVDAHEVAAGLHALCHSSHLSEFDVLSE